MADDRDDERGPAETTTVPPNPAEQKSEPASSPPTDTGISESTDPNASPEKAIEALASVSSLDPTLRQVLFQEQRNLSITFNFLMQSAPAQATPEQRLEFMAKAAELVKAQETFRLQSLERTIELGINAKLRDPDEIQKRQTQATRRGLMALTGITFVLGFCGLLPYLVMHNAPMPVLGGVLALLPVLAVFTGMLASGSPLTLDGAVEILRTVYSSSGTNSPEPRREAERKPSAPDNRRKKRNRRPR
jgi:hypothetical protein